MRCVAKQNRAFAFQPRIVQRFLLVLIGVAAWCGWQGVPASAENWPQWRGPMLNGVSGETGLPIHWSETENIAWRLPLPGPAGSTPVVWGGRIFLTSAAEGELVLLCISTEGKPLWQRVLDGGDRSFRGDEANMASPSPCTDGKSVWALVGTGAIACYDLQGDRRWAFNLQERYGELDIQFGLASSPVLFGQRLYLQLIHGDGDPKTREAAVVCLDAATGEQVWMHERQSDARDECEHSYASPVIFRDSRQAILLTHGADYLIAHSLRDGHELWRCGGMNSPGNYHSALRFVASPAVGEGLIVVPTAKNGPVFGLRPDGLQEASDSSGDVQNGSREVTPAWRFPDNTPDVPSPLVKDGLVYLCRENGNLLCLDAQSGEEVYHERTERDRHRSSPVWADGHLYLTSRGGRVTVVRAGRDFEIVAQNDVGEEIAASPVISNGTIYLRTFESLIAIR